jgi:hypothetical protein
MCFLAVALAAALPAQKKPFQAQSASTVAFSVKDDEETVEIANVAYEMTGSGIPGRPRNERLVLRKTTHTKEVVDAIGMEASTTIQARPLGADLKQKPLYSLTVEGVDAKTVASDLVVISRGLEEVEWWSVYKLGTAAHLFDTYVPLLQFALGWEEREPRYAGVEVPPDDAPDPRLRAPNIVAVLTYASADRVIREALITCDNRNLATLLRSYADSTRKAIVNEKPYSITVTVSPTLASPPASYTVTIPIAKDDLDFAHATTAPALHIAPWKR